MQLKDLDIKLLKQNIPLCLLALASINIMMVVNKLDLPGTIHVTSFWLDDVIPLVLVFIIPYFFYFAYGFLTWTYMLLIKPRMFASYAFTMIVIGVGTGMINILYQTAAPRHPLSGTDMFSNLLRWHYSINRPLTALPSQHVSISIAASYYLAVVFPRYKWLWWSLAILISLSTVFVKEHYAADVITGALLALFAIYIQKLFYKLYPQLKLRD